MNRILLIAHAPLAQALRACALHVFTDCGNDVVAIDVQPNTSPEESLGMARVALHQIEATARPTDGVLVLTDIFGATPCNVASRVVDGQRSKLVTGINLPMLLRSISYRHEPLDALVARAVSGGNQGVMQVAVTAPQNQIRRKHDPRDHDHQQ